MRLPATFKLCVKSQKSSASSNIKLASEVVPPLLIAIPDVAAVAEPSDAVLFNTIILSSTSTVAVFKVVVVPSTVKFPDITASPGIVT